MNIIEIYKPHEREPNHKPSWNTGLIVVEHKNKKYQFWSRRLALEKAVELSTGKEIISDYTHEEN